MLFSVTFTLTFVNIQCCNRYLWY